MHQKAIQIMFNICKAAKAHGVDSNDFVAICGEMLIFSNLDPKITVPLFPEFVRLGSMKKRITDAEPGPAFWKLLGRESLGSDDMPPSQFEKLQQDLIVDKIAAIQNDKTTLLKNLRGLVASDCDMPIHASMVEQVIMLKTAFLIHTCPIKDILEQFSTEELEAAVNGIKNKANAIANSILMYNSGQQFFRVVEMNRDKIQASTDKLAQTTESFGKFREVLPANADDLSVVAKDLQEHLSVALHKVLRLSAEDLERRDMALGRSTEALLESADTFSELMLTFAFSTAFVFELGHTWPEAAVRRVTDCCKALDGLVMNGSFIKLCESVSLDRDIISPTGSSVAARQQALSLLEHLPAAQECTRRMLAGESTMEDGGFLQQHFGMFRMHSAWAAAVFPGAECDTKKRQFDVTISERWFPDGVKTLLSDAVGQSDVGKKIIELKNLIPVEFAAGCLPAQVAELGVDTVALGAKVRQT